MQLIQKPRLGYQKMYIRELLEHVSIGVLAMEWTRNPMQVSSDSYVERSNAQLGRCNVWIIKINFVLQL